MTRTAAGRERKEKLGSRASSTMRGLMVVGIAVSFLLFVSARILALFLSGRVL
jgi:hypothetical protein